MPIYAYKCESCGHRQDVLQKVSDPALGTCPACGAQSFAKQVTAAGFQLKGSGWYATDFRGGKPTAEAEKADKAEKPDKQKSDKGSAKPDAPAGPESKPAATAPTAAPAAAKTGAARPEST